MRSRVEKRHPSSAWLGLAGLVALIAALLLTTPVWAQEESEASQQKTKQTAAMGEKVYNKLAEAQALAEAEDYVAAEVLLDEVRNMSKLSAYETAQLYNFYGYIYYITEQHHGLRDRAAATRSSAGPP